MWWIGHKPKQEQKPPNLLQSMWIDIKNFASSIFGFSSTQKTVVNANRKLVPEPSPIVLTGGAKTTYVNSQKGNSSKPIVFYSESVINDPISSSIGTKFNIGSYSLDFSLGLNNTGIKFSAKKNNITSSCGLSASLAETKIGFDFEAERQVQSDIYETYYGNASASFWGAFAIYKLFTTGQWNGTPTPQYSY
jgi:hypothetical protein